MGHDIKKPSLLYKPTNYLKIKKQLKSMLKLLAKNKEALIGKKCFLPNIN